MNSDLDEAIARVAEAINRINEDRPDGDTTLLIETTAGQGTTLGRSFEEIAAIIDQVEDEGAHRRLLRHLPRSLRPDTTSAMRIATTRRCSSSTMSSDSNG
ncbi:MAG: TIM barrel protein [Thermomicrobiales bacterium]